MNFSKARSRHPDELFLLVLCLISGAGIVFGGAPEPGSIETALPRWAVILWGAALLLGPATTLLGIFWPGKRASDGLIIEQVGQVTTGSVAMFYAAILLVSTWPAGILAGTIISGFAAARFWRWVQIQRLLHDMRAVSDGV